MRRPYLANLDASSDAVADQCTSTACSSVPHVAPSITKICDKVGFSGGRFFGEMYGFTLKGVGP